ncbi:uncharacterized protein LOC141643793 [Silene latifolia]|uniref:uncharacterized protein LOC141643793 n=1 Tax=Silene latifolia TaxID=37657 RepID=UPI003D76ED3B
MGNIDDAVPFFGEGFNKIYPLIMVIYTILVASNFFDRVIDYFGSWKRFRFQSEADDMDGFDAAGMIILQRERSWLEQGHRVGEQVIPLARNFNNITLDVESGSNKKEDHTVEMKGSSFANGQKASMSKKVKPESQQYSGNKEAISNKYSAIREQSLEPTVYFVQWLRIIHINLPLNLLRTEIQIGAPRPGGRGATTS